MNAQEIRTCDFCRADKSCLRQYLHAANKPAVGDGFAFISYCNDCGLREEAALSPERPHTPSQDKREQTASAGWEEEFREIYYSEWGTHPADKLALMLSFISHHGQEERQRGREEAVEYIENNWPRLKGRRSYGVMQVTDNDKDEGYNEALEEMEKIVDAARSLGKEGE